MSTKSLDQKNKEAETKPVEEERKESRGRKSLQGKSPMREKAKKSSVGEKVEDEPKESLGVDKKPRQKSKSPGGLQRGQKTVKRTEETGEILKKQGSTATEGEKPKKPERNGRTGAKSSLNGKTGPKVDSGRNSVNKVRSPSPQLPVKTDQEKFEQLFLVRQRKHLPVPMSLFITQRFPNHVFLSRATQIGAWKVLWSKGEVKMSMFINSDSSKEILILLSLYVFTFNSGRRRG